MKVINKNGTAIDFETAVSLMDEGIRESVSRRFEPCSEQEFFTAYETVHEKMYGEWELSKENPCIKAMRSDQ